MEITPKTSTKFRSVYSTPDVSPWGSSAEKPVLSASLRERLKRSRRAFTSPRPVAKRLCVDQDQDQDQAPQAAAHSPDSDPVLPETKTVDMNRNQLGSSSSDLIQLRDQLRKEVKEKSETLRRLQLVKMYRTKNDLSKLQSLIDKWRSCAQAAVYELQSEVTQDGKKLSLTELIDLLGLDDNILHFDRTEEDFST